MCIAMAIAVYVWLIAFCLGSSLTSTSTMAVLSKAMMTDAEARQPEADSAENQGGGNQERLLRIDAVDVSSVDQQQGPANRTRHQENDDDEDDGDDDDDGEVRFEDRQFVFVGANYRFSGNEKGGEAAAAATARRESERATPDKDESGRSGGGGGGGGNRRVEIIGVEVGRGGGGVGVTKRNTTKLRLQDRSRRQENPRNVFDAASLSDVIASADVEPTEAAAAADAADDDLQTTSTAIDDDDDDDVSLSPLDFLDALQAAQPRDCAASSSTASSSSSSSSTTSSRTTLAHHALPPSLHPVFAEQTGSLVQIANVLNNLFLATTPPADERLLAFSQNAVFYYALVRAAVESHELVSAAAIVFERGEDDDDDRTTAGQPSGPLAYRNRTNGLIYTRDLANVTHGVFAKGDAPGDQPAWPWINRSPSLSTSSSIHSSHSAAVFPEKMKTACVSEGSGPGIARHSADQRLMNASPAVTEAADGAWSRPYFDCASGSRTWLLTYSLPVFGCSNSDIIFKGVAKIELDLGRVDINQCPDSGDIFEKTDRCHASTSCSHVTRHGFRRGGYHCTCRTGYYLPNSATPGTGRHGHTAAGSISASYFNGTEIERNRLLISSQAAAAVAAAAAAAAEFACLPCAEGCETCSDATPCPSSDDVIVSVIALVLQSVTMTAMLLAAVAVIRLRQTKVMKASFWLLLEIIIFGALLIYATVVIQYVTPSDVTCILIPWFREIGFIIIYGSLTLKVYRVLAEFQSRKAQRILLRDKDLLKYLAAMVTIVIGYMVTWTVINVDHIWKGTSMVHVENGTRYFYCNSTYWDYVIELEEFLFLLAAVYICYCIRSAPSFYLESKYISWAIYNETALSAIFNVIRHCLWSTVRPNYLYWMYFIRSQLTVTVTMLLVIGTKVWYIHRPPDDAICRRRTYSTTDAQDSNAPEATKLTPSIGYGIGGGGGAGGAGGGEGDVGDINLSDMNPDDIRAELKRLYTQLQIYKTKSMRKDNPHISKRRGGRKPTHRRFSLQAFHYNKHKLQQGGSGEAASCEHENEASRSPEESTNSVDVVPVTVTVGEGGDAYGVGGGEIRARSTSLSSRTAAAAGHR